MRNRYIWGALLLVAFVFCIFMSCMRGVCAHEIKEANLVFCDTTEQVETFIRFKGDTEIAIAWLNTEKPASCAYRPIRFYDGGEVKKVQTYDGLYSINKIAVLEVLGEHEWLTGFPMIQYVAVQPDPSMLIRVQDHTHSKEHDFYREWASRKTGNCCSDRDCEVLQSYDVRETKGGTEVRVGIEWCPVLREHYIIRGKSPDWNVPHACINKNPNASYPSVCDRLLCYAGVGGI